MRRNRAFLRVSLCHRNRTFGRPIAILFRTSLSSVRVDFNSRFRGKRISRRSTFKYWLKPNSFYANKLVEIPDRGSFEFTSSTTRYRRSFRSVEIVFAINGMRVSGKSTFNLLESAIQTFVRRTTVIFERSKRLFSRKGCVESKTSRDTVRTPLRNLIFRTRAKTNCDLSSIWKIRQGDFIGRESFFHRSRSRYKYTYISKRMIKGCSEGGLIKRLLARIIRPNFFHESFVTRVKSLHCPYFVQVFYEVLIKAFASLFPLCIFYGN